VYIAFTEEQEQLRRELRDYFSRLMTPEVRDQLMSGEGEYGNVDLYRGLVRQMGEDGWLGIGWPKEYGGQARSMIDQMIFTDEASTAGAPVPFLTLSTVGPTIMQWGTDEQKRTSPAYSPVSCTSPSAIPSRARAPILPRSRRERCGTATSTSSTGRSCSPA
jgi:alkylation response protein AidB-like acyl-CoA dehydrogenase